MAEEKVQSASRSDDSALPASSPTYTEKAKEAVCNTIKKAGHQKESSFERWGPL